MKWTPYATLSEIVQAERNNLPIIVTTYDDAGTPNEIAMRVGQRYRIATEHINVLCTVVRIDYGARSPLFVTYATEWGDYLLHPFSPDSLLSVTPL